MLTHTQKFKHLEDSLVSTWLHENKWGIEREGQRITRSGDLALTDHPAQFGDKLSNPSITTDFAESQLELITAPHPSIKQAMKELSSIHRTVNRVLLDRGERLWPLSMPPRLPDEDAIPIAKFGESPEGKMKTAYRKGLAKKYGKKMQMISGLHVNFSFSPLFLKSLANQLGMKGTDRQNQDELYFAMARNFLRYRWLLIYLFGSSPTADVTYYPVLHQEFSVINHCCPGCCPAFEQYEKYASSLRVSRYGYANTIDRPYISFNSVEEHLADYRHMLQTSWQHESEFYCSIRLKPKLEEGLSMIDSLEKNGVSYSEIRIMDLNPFAPEGITESQLRFIHVFLLWCLLSDSNHLTKQSYHLLQENHHKVSLLGQQPNLKLCHPDKGKINMKDWMDDIFQDLKYISVMLDEKRSDLYQKTVEDEYEKVKDNRLTPAYRMMDEMKKHGEDFIQFGVRYANIHASALKGAVK